MRSRTRWQRVMAALLCAASALMAPGLARAQVAVAAPPDARAILLGMAEFLAKTPRMSVTVQGGYDAVQASGHKVEWNEIRKLTVIRPDRLRMESERSDGSRSLVVFDGAAISTFDESGRVYAQAPQPGGIDEALVYFVRDLGMRLPLAALLVSRAPAELDRRIKSVSYVEKTSIFGAPSHHIAGWTDTVGFQAWIAAGDQPLPLRIVLTYKDAPGQPQFRAQFSSWNLAAEPLDSLFTFTPPPDATRIPFVAAMPQMAPGSRGAAARKGAKP
jgi:hypothetical protein